MTATQTRNRGTGGRPPACEIEERRNNLLAVATTLFLSNGYEATSLENIAKAAGASKTTIYRNFGDKADLFGIIFNRFIEPIWPTLVNVCIEGKSPREVLSAFGHQMVSTTILNPDGIAFMRLIYRESPRFPELTRIFGETERTTINVVAGYLRLATQQKLLRLTDPDWAASQFLELIWGILSRRLLIGTISFPDETERQRVVESAVALFLNGVGEPSTAAAPRDTDPG